MVILPVSVCVCVCVCVCVRVSVVSVLNCRTVERSKYFYFFLLVLSTAICLLLRPLFFSLSRALSRCYYAVSVFRVFLCISNCIYLCVSMSHQISSGLFVFCAAEKNATTTTTTTGKATITRRGLPRLLLLLLSERNRRRPIPFRRRDRLRRLGP